MTQGIGFWSIIQYRTYPQNFGFGRFVVGWGGGRVTKLFKITPPARERISLL